MNFAKGPLQVALLLIVVCFGSATNTLASSAERQQQISPRYTASELPLREGDIFAGPAEMPEEHFDTVQLTLIINKISVRETDLRDIVVEATVSMNAVDHHLTYTLHGYYLPAWRQLYLYGLREPNLIPSTGQKSRGFASPTLPVGLAGELSLDGLTLYGQVAFNGSATLKRERNTVQDRVHLVHSGLSEK
jgi:hypothetical protein